MHRNRMRKKSESFGWRVIAKDSVAGSISEMRAFENLATKCLFL